MHISYQVGKKGKGRNKKLERTTRVSWLNNCLAMHDPYADNVFTFPADISVMRDEVASKLDVFNITGVKQFMTILTVTYRQSIFSSLE